MKIFRSEIERVIEDDYSFKALRYILRNTDYIGGLGSGEIDSRSWVKSKSTDLYWSYDRLENGNNI